MDKFNNQIGFLVLKEDGAVLESGGELENDERSANIFLDLVNLTESVDESFMPNNSCERISIVYEDHSYNICLSNRRIYIVKLRNGGAAAATNRSGGLGMSSNNGVGVYVDGTDGNMSSTAVLT
ncbi:ragulator complex protein LAMTOR4 homolog [Stomoxys calcitrans]|uniref:ragulator complex protein LAMTOR4 homolog n=1 Tax=Stomoxys calcitrans TaxID=35570 RepID=UPI0027E29213|nr:ragulator complex protein LAMTOR4 homolog [Stomoxys calcitrans]